MASSLVVRRNRPIVPVAIGVVMLVVGVSLGACTSGSDLRVNAPNETRDASVLLEGRTQSGATVSIASGAIPVETTAGEDGSFSVEVPLRPDAQNRLHVRAIGKGDQSDADVVVRQLGGRGPGTMRGQVFDSTTGEPVGGAAVRFGTVTATTRADGGYELGPVPSGLVVAQVRKTGSLARSAIAAVVDGVGDAGSTFLQQLAPPVIIDEGGASFSGPGWSVEIPGGALSTPTAIHVTPLSFDPTMSVLGAPLVDLSPSGLRFEAPIAVTVDPAVLGLEAEAVRVVGFDPEAAETRPFDTTVVGGELRFEITDLRGEEFWQKGKPGTDPDSTWCTPYGSAIRARVTSAYLQATLLPILAAGIGQDSVSGFGAYLTPGSPTHSRRVITTSRALREFATETESREFRRAVWNDVQLALSEATPALNSPDAPTTRRLQDMPSTTYPGQSIGQLLPIEWGRNVWSTPANLAGGVGGAHLTNPGVSIADERHIRGSVRLMPSASATGVLTRVDLEANDDWELQVLDAIDFCPGNPGNKAQRIFATTPMSRLEVTPHSRGHYATPQLVEALTKLETSSLVRDVTELFPSNDGDNDDAPNEQPWTGASFPLDNCPRITNADQADSDSDGLGDTCDAPESDGWYGTITWTAKGRDPNCTRSCYQWNEKAVFTLDGHTRNRTHRTEVRLEFETTYQNLSGDICVSSGVGSATDISVWEDSSAGEPTYLFYFGPVDGNDAAIGNFTAVGDGCVGPPSWTAQRFYDFDTSDWERIEIPEDALHSVGSATLSRSAPRQFGASAVVEWDLRRP